MKSVSAGLLLAALALTACGKSGGAFGGRGAPDEFAISRQAPLVVPPDYSLAPPRPGAPRSIGTDSQQQALEALFGPGVRPPPKTPAEQNLLDKAGAGRSDSAARSNAGSRQTVVVDKGALVRDIVAAPAGTENPAVAQASVGGQ